VKRLCQGLALAAFLSAPVVAFGQVAADEEKTKSQQPVVEAEVKETEPSGPNAGKLSWSGGTDFATAYFFRGYNQEDQGLIAQPYANLYLKAVDTDSLKVTPYLGTWNSLHSEDTLANAGGGPDAWYESDFIAGVDVSSGAFTFGVVYTAYTYPGGAFETIQELGAKVTWDDTEFQKGKLGFALKPYVAVYAETSDGNGSEDWYGEVGISPGVYTFNKDGKYPVALAVPIIAGFNLKDYYFDADGDEQILGYISAAVTASVPLAFVPSDYGSWNLTGTFQYLFLNADSTEFANHGDDSEFIGKLGIAFAY
jgi:hypothetical protein